MPVLAAAGAGALLVAIAAWWALDGREMFDGWAALPSAAPSASSVATTAPETESPPTASAPTAREPDVAPPVQPDVSTGAPAVAAEPTADPAASSAVATAPTSTSTTDAASARAAANGADANEQRSETAPPPAPANDFEAVAAEWMGNSVPRIAQTAERQLAPVLGAAARSTAELRRRGELRAAAQAARSSSPPTPDVTVHANEARSLNEAALVAYWRDNSVADALRLQTQAFGADPLDPEIVGNLALLRLKEKPPQPEAARQLALHALTLKDDRFPTGRIEDWTTLAIANALTGREKDARNTWFVSMALATDLQRQCNAAVRAQATYGERLRPSVQAMLQRARSSAAYGRCEAAQSSLAEHAERQGSQEQEHAEDPARDPVKWRLRFSPEPRHGLAPFDPRLRHRAPARRARRRALPGPASAQQKKDSVALAMVLEPAPGLDPTVAAAAAIGEVVHMSVLEGLTKINMDGKISPLLAESWTIDPDGRVYTFKLRKNVKFHDGEAFDASDVKFSFERAKAPGSTNKAKKAVFDNISRIDTPDPHTVIVVLNNADGNFLFRMGENTAVILDPKSAPTTATKPIGTGPFKFESWAKGSSITLVKNDQFRDAAKIAMKKVTFRFINDPAAQVAALLAGDIDGMPRFGALESLKQFQSDPRFTVAIGGTEGKTIMTINNKKKPFDDVRVRRALAAAIDRKAIIDGAQEGFGVPIGSHMVPSDAGYVDLTGANRTTRRRRRRCSRRPACRRRSTSR